RSRASSSHTGVKANGWNTRRTFERPRKSESRTRSGWLIARSNSGALSPVLTAIRMLLSRSGRPIVPPPTKLLREVRDLEAGRVVVRVGVALAVSACFGRSLVPGGAEHRRRPGVSVLADVLARLPDRDRRGVRLGCASEVDRSL